MRLNDLLLCIVCLSAQNVTLSYHRFFLGEAQYFESLSYGREFISVVDAPHVGGVSLETSRSCD